MQNSYDNQEKLARTEQLLCQWESGVCRVLGEDGGLYDRQCGSICRPPDRAADILQVSHWLAVVR